MFNTIKNFFAKIFKKSKTSQQENPKLFKKVKLNYDEVNNCRDYVFDHKIRIQGTKYDRRIKITPEIHDEIRRKYESGYTIAELAKCYNVSWTCIKYHVDDNYKARTNEIRPSYGWYGNKKHITVEDRVKYKKDLIKDDKVFDELVKEYKYVE